ncbi:transposase [Micromonospora chalcea]
MRNRFRSESAYASYCGVAPIEMSSENVQRHRLSRAGDRQLNCAPARYGHGPRSNERPRAGTTTSPNEPPAKPTRRPCAA